MSDAPRPQQPDAPSPWSAQGAQQPAWGSPDAGAPAGPSWGQPGSPAAAPAPGAWGNPEAGAGTTPQGAPQQTWGNPSGAADAPPAYGPAGPATYPAPGGPSPVAVQEGPENVGMGIALSLLSIVIGAGLTIALAQVGFIASITAWAAAAAAVWLYTKGAGSGPRKGIVPLLVVVLVGVAVQFFALIGAALWKAYRGRGGSGGQWQFVLSNLFNPDAIGDYLINGVMLLVFAGLGIAGILRGLTRR